MNRAGSREFPHEPKFPKPRLCLALYCIVEFFCDFNPYANCAIQDIPHWGFHNSLPRCEHPIISFGANITFPGLFSSFTKRRNRVNDLIDAGNISYFG